MEEIPPSTLIICPVIKLALSESNYRTVFAISSASPILFNGWRSSDAFRFDSLFNNFSASGVFVIEGAMQFTLIVGANSAASDLVNPSTAPFADAIEE